MDKIGIIIIGFGSRGQLFGGYIKADERTELTAVADVNPEAREKAIKEFGIKPENCFKSAEEILAKGKIADAAFICTQDKQHKEHAITAMRLGYDICLEKPIATTMEDCEDILKVQEETGRKVMICHVLRYSPFYMKMREVIKSGEIGDAVTISQTENVAYWHDAHSYVRGAWRNKEESSPMILAKCCHDLDIILKKKTRRKGVRTDVSVAPKALKRIALTTRLRFITTFTRRTTRFWATPWLSAARERNMLTSFCRTKNFLTADACSPAITTLSIIRW